MALTGPARVVIVGAGPAGAALAWLLATRGVTVTLVEEARGWDRPFRGEALMPSGQAALETMGLGSLLQQLPGQAVDGWRFILDRRELFTVREPQPGCRLVSQPALLQALIQRGQQQGLDWRPGRGASPLWREDGRVRGVLLEDGERLAADLVVAADGRRSGWRQAAGLDLESGPGGLNLLWFRLPCPACFRERNLFTTVLTGTALFSLVRGAVDDQLQLAWVLPPGARPAAQSCLPSHLWAERLAALSPPWLANHIRRHGDALSPPIAVEAPLARARSWHRPGLLLLGDAAHPMSPVRAQGINMALRDAVVAANHLVPPLAGAAPEGAIDRALAAIAAERESEIIALQQMQASEASRGQLLRRLPPLSAALGRAAPLVGPLIARRWWAEQQLLRLGCASVRLRV